LSLIDAFNQPNFDLAWCAFVIENDYLQISNSISSKPVLKMNKASSGELTEVSKQIQKDNRRFSKTISVNFATNKKSPLET